MSNKMSLTEAYGKALLELAEEDDRIVAIDADVGIRMGTKYLREKFPNRYIQVGIAEQNAVGVAAGLAASGKICFTGTIAVFITGRAWEQLRQSVAYPNLNVKIIGGYSGMATGPDGATHQACEDISIIRSLPNFKILVPCDPLEAEQATRIAYETEGPVYIRMVRPALHFILPSDYKMEIGKAVILHEGQDITIIAYGMTVPIALTAASNLKSEGISARVLNMSTIKPIDKNSILTAAQETSRIITVEDHSIIGGLGSAVSEIVAESGKGKVTRIGIPDTFGESCPYEDLYNKFGLNVENIVKKVKENL